ncbi:hypothetical protein L9F63_016614, partial [Diploptera punctata]
KSIEHGRVCTYQYSIRASSLTVQNNHGSLSSNSSDKEKQMSELTFSLRLIYSFPENKTNHTEKCIQNTTSCYNDNLAHCAPVPNVPDVSYNFYNSCSDFVDRFRLLIIKEMHANLLNHVLNPNDPHITRCIT